MAAPSVPTDSALGLRLRLAAWLVTGPPAHFVAGALDWVELLTRWGWARLRRREVRW